MGIRTEHTMINIAGDGGTMPRPTVKTRGALNMEIRRAVIARGRAMYQKNVSR